MFIAQNLLWIVLPNGIQNDGGTRQLRLSVFVNPRLLTDQGTTLFHFRDFLDWGTRMQPDKVSFELEVDDGTKLPCRIVSAKPDPQLWRSLFTRNVPVRPYNFKEDDFSNRPIVSFPVSSVLKYLKERYQLVANDFDLPYIKRNKETKEGQIILEEVFCDLIRMFNNKERPPNPELIKSLQTARDEALQRQVEGRRGPLITPKGGYGGILEDFFQTMLFHYRPSAKPVNLPEGSAARSYFEEEIDFHQMLSALGDFPVLMRRLGLIFDLLVPADAMPKSIGGSDQRKVRVIPTWSSTLPICNGAKHKKKTCTANYSPWTVYDYKTNNGQDIFTASSALGEISAGFWTPQKDIDLVQVDIDGSALKALNFASSLARVEDNPRTIDAPEQAGVPALRTGGISVVLNGNASHLNDTFNRSAELNDKLNKDPSKMEPLYAEDLTKGYRLDVLQDGDTEWHSLHERVGKYTILHSHVYLPEISDEGFNQPSITSMPIPNNQVPDPAQELYVHESLFTWDGWSLSAPRPGKSISPNPSNEPDALPQHVDNSAMTHLGLETTFKVKDGTLPRLRFGKGYKMRVRTVDLAGNGLTLDDAKSFEANLSKFGAIIPDNHQLTYGRFEPVNPPDLVPRQFYSPSGNPDDPNNTAFSEGESLERLVIRSNFDQSAEEYVVNRPYYSFCERHVVAPKVSLDLVEKHGLLDAALDAIKTLPKDKALARIQEVYNLAKREAGSLNNGSHTVFIHTNPSSNEGYSVHKEKQLILPYLPDPLAIGVVCQGLPGGSLPPIKFDREGKEPWYTAKPFRLRLIEGSSAPVWSEDTRVLTVQLPKSGIAHVRVSSLFGGTLNEMGLWQWLCDGVANGKITQKKLMEIVKSMQGFGHWMFTPYRDITLVHAVQQPLLIPEPQLKVRRFDGVTTAYLYGGIKLHAPSTSKLDILAEWTELRDDPLSDAPEDVKFSSHVMELPTSLDDDRPINVGNLDVQVLILENDDRLLFDSKHAESARTNFQKELEKTVNPEDRRYLQDQINLVSKVKAHEFGDTKYRSVRYQVSATSRFREYFSPSSQDNFTRTSEVDLEILSTARPIIPSVRYILPTFSWSQTTDYNKNVTSVRKGGSLRVYLDRPWYSSGEGEFLGIVLGQNIPDQNNELYKYSSFRGQDPVWASSDLPVLELQSFKNSYKIFRNVSLEMENNIESVDVVCFTMDKEKNFDPKQKLWFCDIDLDMGDSYYPFIRLALARFQPNSILGKELSKVVLADFVQTAPTRALTVTRDIFKPGQFNISVTGVANITQNSTVTTNQVEVLVQRRNTDIKDETLGWEDLPLKGGLTPGNPNVQDIVVWNGQVSIPAEYQSGQLRMLVQEYEIWPLATPPGLPPSTDKRLVYVDTISL
ncbi:hypothetical protein [Bacillus cereus]